MSVTIGAAVASMNVAKSIAVYMGLIESSASQINSLVHQSFKSAIMNLELAKTSSLRSQSEEYMKEARNKFIEAIAVEKDEALVSAFVGLAMCQYLLGDRANANLSISQIAGIKLSNSEQVKAGAKRFVFGSLWSALGAPGKAYDVFKATRERKQNFEEFKFRAIKEVKL